MNCLSCNKGNDGYEALQHVKGQDGRLYVGGGHAKEQTYSDGPNDTYPMSAYPVQSPKQILKNRGHKTSLSMSVHNGAQIYGARSGAHLLPEDTVNLNFNGKNKANIFGTIIDDRYQRQAHMKKSIRNSIIDRSSNKFLTAETSKMESKQRMFTNVSAASGPRKKLPIGFLIQQEQRGEYNVSNS